MTNSNLLLKKLARKMGALTTSSPVLNPRLVMVLLFFAGLVCPTHSFAKDLSKRLGVGYRNQMNVNVPQLAAQYYASPEMAFGLSLGVESGNDQNRLAVVGRVHRVIFPEDNLNFYMGGAGGLLSGRVGTSNESGFELMGFLGCEFFLPGLDSLSFSFEAGVSVVSLPSGVTFRTFGDSPIRAGILFYF